MMSPALINELQDCFDCRGRLRKVAYAIKCYTKNSSIFYSYTDGFGNKKCVNIPIEPQDLLPLLEKQVENIDKEIQRISCESEYQEFSVIIRNSTELKKHISDYQARYPLTATDMQTIRTQLAQSVKWRVGNNQNSTDDYHIPVCSDWQNKVYVFSIEAQEENVLFFNFKEIYKL